MNCRVVAGEGTKLGWSGSERLHIGLGAHGTRHCYQQGCRCEPCTEANARYLADYRERRQLTEGDAYRTARPDLEKRLLPKAWAMRGSGT